MELTAIKDAFDRVTKKQKLSSSKAQQVLDLIDKEIKQTLQKLQSSIDRESQIDCKSALADLKAKLKDIAPLSQFESTQKELNLALSKYPKILEKSCIPDISKAYKSPLSVTMEAGIRGLPPLLKFMNVMAGKRQEWQSMKQLPVPVEFATSSQGHAASSF